MYFLNTQLKLQNLDQDYTVELPHVGLVGTQKQSQNIHKIITVTV